MPATTTRRKATAAPVEPEIVEDEEFEEMEDELEEVEETPAPAAKPKRAAKPTAGAKPAAKPATEAPAFGSPWLAQHVTEVTGETFDARGIRMLLRKLAKDGKHDRKVGTDRERYSFSGPEDVTVKAVVHMVKTGEAKQLKQAGLDKVKQDAAVKKAAAKAAKEAEAQDEDEDIEEADEVEEAPKPTPRRRAAKPAATAGPAKAAPSTRRKAAASA